MADGDKQPQQSGLHRLAEHDHRGQAQRGDRHHEGQDRTELRALGEQGLRHRDRTENVRIHRDAHQHGQDNAEGIAAAQNGLNP